MRYCEASKSVNLKSVLAKKRAFEGGGVLSRGKGSLDHDHPSPRWLPMRSKASRKTDGLGRRRSMGVFC